MGLVVNSLLRLKEPSVLLRCRKYDVNLEEDVLDAVKEEYVEKAMVHSPEIIIDHIHLPPAPSHHNAHGPSCSGGVILASRDWKVVCENTLDARLEVVFHKKLPEVMLRNNKRMKAVKTLLLVKNMFMETSISQHIVTLCIISHIHD